MSPAKKDKLHFDEHKIPQDVRGVLRASALLSVGEFRVFEIAYEDWYGESGDESLIEKYFTGYMFNDIVPPWVRHFCKKILQLDDDGDLDPADFGIINAPATTQQVNRGLEAIMWVTGAMIVLFVLGEGAAQVMRLQCMFPPCY